MHRPFTEKEIEIELYKTPLDKLSRMAENTGVVVEIIEG